MEESTRYNNEVKLPQYVFSKDVNIDSSDNTTTTSEDDNALPPAGLGWFITALFILGAVVGGGLVALPVATVNTNLYFSIIFIVFMASMATYTAHVLGQCWTILQKRWPKYTDHCRKPYPEIARRALGKKWKTAISLCVDITQFGVAVVYLLLAAKNIRDLILMYIQKDISYCYVVLIVAICFLPFTFLKSPQDFWAAVVVGMFTSSISAVLITVGSISDYDTCNPERQLPPTDITNYFLAVGTYMFSYCNHGAFPTIQHDMKKPGDFTKSVSTAFFFTSIIYITVSVVGYLTYGDSMKHSVISSLQIDWIQQTVNILITSHCILTLTIVLNPLNQELEDFFNVPHEFGVQRMLLRTLTMLAVVFVAESVPNFGPLLDLVGGSTMTLTGLVCPCLFYLKLNASEVDNKNRDPEEIGLREVLSKNNLQSTIICCSIIVIAVFFAITTTGSAVYSLSTAQFVVPCYLQPFFGADKTSGIGAVDCCGHYQNVTRNNEIVCTAANFAMYYD
ncbi:unnamed protein product [Bursaphelenchus okinawaensis]|uniref:Amino acid transporter transmembrane domain-containing protein n=1 Tax=Bursaphelenchus okinawaensis TaxID=465554 RepID=A0A811KWU2_9BILA|nr:unnamed protein product [Bursaphelenchus okinawaensis]CAG9113476.1 unnamed protein product [Bursaphelenchus okinawaensis]